MSNDGQWQIRIQHILDSISKIQRYTAGFDEGSFAQNEMVVDAVIKNFQVIGEAARKLPDEVQSRYPAVPWSLMQRMRHVLVHDYYRIDEKIIWRTVQENLPPLIEPLKSILQDNPLPPESSSADPVEN